MSGDVEVIQLGPSSDVTPIEIEAITAGGVIEVPGQPGSGGGTTEIFTHYQLVPQSVWLVEHELGRYPASWSLFDNDGRECGQYVVQHLDLNTLRVAMDVPTAGLFRCI